MSHALDRAAHTYRALASESRVRILDVLESRGEPTTVDDLAAEVGLHVNTTREHLDRLVDSGFVTWLTEHRSTRGRPRKLYSLVKAAPRATGHGAREHLATLLLAGYGRAIADPGRGAEAAGRRWALEEVGQVPDAPVGDAAPDQLAVLGRHLDDLGFEPVVDREMLEVRLRRCPLHDLVLERADVVCGVHLGFARGVLAAHGGPLAVERLVPRSPHAGSGECVLKLRRSA